MIEPTADVSPPRRRALSKPSEPTGTVSASVLALHLDCSRTFLGKLEAEGVISREPGGGYNLDKARVAYIRHLRRARSQSPRAEADAGFQRAKTRLLELKIGERERVLMHTDEAVEAVTELVGLFRTEAGQLSARISGRDLVERRRVEGIVDNMLHRIADRAAERSAGFTDGKKVEADDDEE